MKKTQANKHTHKNTFLSNNQEKKKKKQKKNIVKKNYIYFQEKLY